MKVPQWITPVIITPMHRENTLNVLLLVSMGWTLVIVIAILCQALKSPIDKELGDNICIAYLGKCL
jgi:predicted membrane channel-forming protein YqfA (hemolysin III family)